MYIRDIVTMKSPYREDFTIKGYSFGKGEKAACIMGPIRGNEIQQLYICSQLVKALKELEANNCISSNKEILVIPSMNHFSMNIGRRFWTMDNEDLNRKFPGNDYGQTTERIAHGIMEEIKYYSYGIQFASFYVSGEFIPHVRMMETGFQNTSLANLFGLPYVVVRKPRPVDTKTLNYNWQCDETAAFSVYTNINDEIDVASAKQAVAAVLRFLTRMGIVKYESHSGYISHVILEEDLANVHSNCAGIFRNLVKIGEEIRYHEPMGEIIDPYEGDVIETILAPTEGIIFFAHRDPLVNENDMVYRIIHRLHQ
ncbi:MAG: M14 family metallopeptidase [Lachnospiraceae bacterium]|nr:M14 family metallopeptidase [Lachnospiraceae bacterium]